ncbi:MAG TPA: hypothetical protein VGD08_21735 [Stellaceae bacterium]
MSRILVSATPATSQSLHDLGRQATGLRSTLAAAAVASAIFLLPNVSQAQSFYAAALPEASSTYNANNKAPGVSAEQPRSFVELGLQAQGVDPYRTLGAASPIARTSTSPTADEAKTFVERALLAQGFLERRI